MRGYRDGGHLRAHTLVVLRTPSKGAARPTRQYEPHSTTQFLWRLMFPTQRSVPNTSFCGVQHLTPRLGQAYAETGRPQILAPRLQPHLPTYSDPCHLLPPLPACSAWRSWAAARAAPCR